MAIGRTDLGAARLDAFVDAAFAFALTLLVIGSSAVPDSYEELLGAIRRVPAFLIGFALIGMFWHGHVRWRRYGGGGSLLSVFLSFALVFLVLVYAYPLRLMAVSMIDWLAGVPGVSITRERLGGLFTIYGLGFAAMSATMLLLFVEGRRHAPDSSRLGMSGEIGIWAILLGSGLLSAAIAQIEAAAPFAAFAYAPLAVVVPAFAAWFWRRRGD
jgi:hypothetical protein